MQDKPYRSIVGAIGYTTSVGVRGDCAFAQKECARYNANPGPRHWAKLLQIVQYLRKTPKHGVFFPKAGGFQLTGSSDADYNGDTDERLSTTGVVIKFGGAPILTMSRTQKYAAKSVGQSEHGALAQMAAELLFFRHALLSLDLPQGVTGVEVNENIQCLMESDSAVALAAARRPDNWPSDKFKHIESHKMFWHQYVKDKVLKLVKVPTELMPADVLTKNFLSVEKFENAAAHIVRPLPKMLQIGQV